jgi:DNA-binding NarL/FixJ family response regulator
MTASRAATIPAIGELRGPCYLRARLPRKDRRIREELTRALASAPTLEACLRAADLIVRPALGATAITWSTVDPATLLHTHCVIHADLGQGQVVLPTDRAQEQRIFELEWEDQDPNTFTALYRTGVRAAALRRSCDPAKVTRFAELLAPQGCFDELRALCVLDGALWGTFTSYRFGQAQDAFDSEDEALAASLSEPIARALRRCMLRAACTQTTHPERPTMVVVDAHGQIAVRSADAGARLAELGDRLEPLLASLVATARAQGEATAQIAIGRGVLAFHATLAATSASTFDGSVSVIIEQPHRPALAPLMLQALELSPREQEIAKHLFAGASRKEIAEHLGLEASTVGDHLKAIYRKAHVDGRAALLARMYFDFFAGPKAKGAHPGPWGYFLS